MPGNKFLLRAIGCGLLALGLAASARSQCQLNSPSGKIKHVVYVEFDNVHFTRDNPNVPSDLEQMPNLLNFIKQNGALDTGDHTVLISHTANGILTTQTGLYSDNTSIFIANSFGDFTPSGSALFPSAFFYWTDLVSDITPATQDNTFAMTTPAGLNVPAPWVPFTRAGCDVGAFSTANIVLERQPFDVKKVFGANSDQAKETGGNQTNDFIGVAVHCALNSPLCSQQNHAVADMLPDEPGSYTGYQALFGMKYVAPALGGFTDYNGNALSGFSALNFNPQPSQTLAVVETMLKKGIPVVFAYIADAHDNHEGAKLSPAATFGPGEAAYVKQLADYNTAFGTFFANLKAAGIDQSNTLFIFTPDEGDHFSGAAASPAGCDGINVPCTYGVNGVGELDFDLNLAAVNAGDSTPFTYHFDDSATVYVQGNPDPSSPTVRHLEKTLAGVTTTNPQTGTTESILGTGLGASLVLGRFLETLLFNVRPRDPVTMTIAVAAVIGRPVRHFGFLVFPGAPTSSVIYRSQIVGGQTTGTGAPPRPGSPLPTPRTTPPIPPVPACRGPRPCARARRRPPRRGTTRPGRSRGCAWSRPPPPHPGQSRAPRRCSACWARASR